MLSRIARSLYEIGRDVERAQAVIRILEVHHKMGLGRPGWAASPRWLALCEAFGVDTDERGEEALTAQLLVGLEHPFSVRGRIAAARARARALRERISEEMWEHLNRFHLEVADLDLDEIRRLGPSELNRRVAIFCDAFYGLAEDTMIHGAEWHFLRLGRFLERAVMLCLVLDVKRKTLELAPEEEGRPIDFHQWQEMLRSLSGYEPYRRVHDARIVPLRVLAFVLLNPDFPRSFHHCVARIAESLAAVASDAPAQRELQRGVETLLAEIRSAEATGLAVVEGGLDAELQALRRRCGAIAEGLDEAFFRALRPGLAPAVSFVLHGQVQQQ